MKKLLLTLLFFSELAFGAADYLSTDGMTQVMDGVDDGTYHVPLGHSFPYYGGVFTDAWMSSNGFILLYDPVNQFGNADTWNNGCCSGFNPTNQGRFSYMLAPLWTDLRDANATPDAGYYYKTNSDESKFLWYNVNEYGTQNTNTFQVNLWPDGSFDFVYDEVDITSHNTWIGFTGDTSTDVTELQYAQGSIDEFGLNFISQTFNGGRAWWGQDGGYENSLDCSDALNDPNCPGYEQAYFDFQCSADPLYDSTCPGYDNAILVQNLSGQDFIFGDNIEDFYETTEVDVLFEEPVLYEEIDYGYEDQSLGYEEDYGAMSDDSFFDDAGTETYDEVLADPVLEESVEFTEEFSEPIVEEVAEEIFDESFEEEITHIEEDMSINEENLDISEPSVETIDTVEVRDAVETIGTPVNALEIAQQQIANADALVEKNNMSRDMSSSSSDATDETLFDESATNEFLSSDNATDEFTFGDMDAAFEEATLQAVTDPSVVTVTVQESSQEEEQTLNFQMESTSTQMDTGFSAQQDQSFSTGQSITAVLNNVAPNFSKFDVAPPSQQEQQTTQKADAQANNMTEEQLEENLDEFASNMQDSGGFTDQSLTVFLMGRNSGFSQYNNVQLQDVSFYTDRGMPGGAIQNDRNAMLRMMGTDNKHEELISLQYK